MSRTTRAGSAALALALFSAAPAMAQIPGMPLFTNPRFATGFRIHADMGLPTNSDPNGSTKVVQGGANFVLGPVGLEANVGATLNSVNSTNSCSSLATATQACFQNHYTVSALAQLKLYGGGMSNLTISGFGGASVDIDSASMANGLTTGAQNPKQINIPVGVAVGYRIPLGLASLNVWAAPRYNFTRFSGCTGCTNPDPYFGWAVGADIPVFRILSIRAAYDSKKPKGATESINSFGVGASIGVGGMR